MYSLLNYSLPSGLKKTQSVFRVILNLPVYLVCIKAQKSGDCIYLSGPLTPILTLTIMLTPNLWICVHWKSRKSIQMQAPVLFLFLINISLKTDS